MCQKLLAYQAKRRFTTIASLAANWLNSGVGKKSSKYMARNKSKQANSAAVEKKKRLGLGKKDTYQSPFGF